MLLLQELRLALDEYQKSKEEINRYLLTSAMPCGPDNYRILPLAEIASVLDYILLMAYDFAGSWSKQTGHLANLCGPAPSGEAAVEFYLSQSVPSCKLLLGFPAYGRSFINTEPRIPSGFNGVGRGTWELGVYDYKILPLPGSQVVIDSELAGASCYDPQQKELVTYDNVQTLQIKMDWVSSKRLGGLMMWELSGDRGVEDNASLIAATKRWADSSGGLESSVNHVYFPSSIFDNVRQGLSTVTSL